MEVLEFRPIKNKTVNIYLIRREDRDLLSLHHSNLEKIIEKEKFKFAIVDFNDSEVKKYYQTPLSEFIEKFHLPYYEVEIPESIKSYFYVELLDLEVQVEELEQEYEKLLLNNQKDTFKAQSLNSWIYLLKDKVEYTKNLLEYTIKPKWIVKKILDVVNNIKNDNLSIIHFAHEDLISELKKLFEEYNIKVIKYDIREEKLKSIIMLKEG